MSKIPVFRKKITEFLTNEDGKISKQAVLAAGTTLAALSSAVAHGNGDGPRELISTVETETATAAKKCTGPRCAVCDPGEDGTRSNPVYCYAHRNSADYTYNTISEKLEVQHNHHYNHGNHASHGSHSSY